MTNESKYNEICNLMKINGSIYQSIMIILIIVNNGIDVMCIICNVM